MSYGPALDPRQPQQNPQPWPGPPPQTPAPAGWQDPRPTGYQPAPGYAEPYGQQPYGQQPQQWQTPGYPGQGMAPANVATGTFRLILQGNAWSGSWISPTVLIDGRPVVVYQKYGVNDYQLPAGRHRIDIHSQWMWQYGKAAAEIDVPAGGGTQLFYAQPLITFFDGSIGPVPQKRKGMGCFVAYLIGIFVPLCVVLAMIMTMN